MPCFYGNGNIIDKCYSFAFDCLLIEEQAGERERQKDRIKKEMDEFCAQNSCEFIIARI